MSQPVIVKLVCQQEGADVAEIESAGSLSAMAIRQGIKAVGDRRRCPEPNMIKDGVQLTCGRCHSPLYLQAADAEMVLAIPGLAKAVP